MMLSSAHELQIDSAGRVLLPAVLRQHGELVQDVVFVGVSDHVEMWDRDKWNEYRSVVLEELTDIAEELKDFDRTRSRTSAGSPWIPETASRN